MDRNRMKQENVIKDSMCVCVSRFTMDDGCAFHSLFNLMDSKLRNSLFLILFLEHAIHFLWMVFELTHWKAFDWKKKSLIFPTKQKNNK